MSRDKVIPLLQKGWPSTKWEHATVLDFTVTETQDTLRMGVWVGWGDGWEAYYQNGWYLIEQTGERLTWTSIWTGTRAELPQVQAWVRDDS